MMTSRRLSVRLILIAACAALLMGQDRCPDYTQDDHSGEIPAGTVGSGRSRTVTEKGAVDYYPGCDKTLYFTARSEESVEACEGFDFSTLWNRADTEAALQGWRHVCGMDCPQRHSWRKFQEWDCGGDPARAYAVVQYASNCLPEGATGDTGLEIPTAPELAAPMVPPPPPPPVGNLVTTETHIPGGMGCDPPEVIRFEYRVEGVPRPRNFKHLVRQAEGNARLHYDSLTCADGCTKQPFSVDRAEWSWANNVAVVVIYFVPCR